MRLPDHFLSCDWGTTNFRLKVVETSSLKIIHETRSPVGIKKHFEAYSQQTKLDQYDFFEQYLSSFIQLLPSEYQDGLLIASGMITANIGMYELPYSDLPIRGDGQSLNTKKVTLSIGNKAILISGVKAANGMMRGEETQAIGLADFMDNKKGLLVLPGTHSKHLVYQNNRFTKLQNFMTGELFDVLASNSILKQSVVSTAWNEQYKASFLEGVELCLSGNLNANLLSVRARDVLKGTSKADNYFLLSGLVIGSELAYLKNYKDPIFLAAPNSLTPLYSAALSKIVRDSNWKIFDSKEVENALLLGQLKIIKNYGD